MSTLEVNKITPAGAGTTVTLGDSGDSIDITSGATVTNFKSTGIDDNATSTAITIDSSENVGIGTTSPSQNLEVSGGDPVIKITDTNNTTGQTGLVSNIQAEDSAGTQTWVVGNQFGATSFYIANKRNSSTRFETNGTERMRINSAGKVAIGSTTPNRQFNVHSTSIPCARFQREQGDNNNRTHIEFVREGSSVGEIQCTNTTTTYTTSSDHRLKENVIDLADATTRVKQLQPKRFNFIANADITVDGFLAHEVQSIVPEAVTGTHNEVQVWEEGEELPEGVSVGDNKLDGEGNTIPKYQGIDQSKLVPLLTASLQEAIAKIETLETEMTALKARVTTLENA